MVTIMSVALVVTGCAFLIIPVLRTEKIRSEGKANNDRLIIEAKTNTRSLQNFDLGVPAKINLPRLSIYKEILPGYYNENSRKWTLNDTHAFYMTQAKTPIIYGHNTDEVFKPLDGVAENELLRVINAEGKVFLFAYIGDEHVPPTASDVVHDFRPNTVLLMTCSGPQYQTRRILAFTFIGQESVPDATKQAITI